MILYNLFELVYWYNPRLIHVFYACLGVGLGVGLEAIPDALLNFIDPEFDLKDEDF